MLVLVDTGVFVLVGVLVGGTGVLVGVLVEVLVGTGVLVNVSVAIGVNVLVGGMGVNVLVGGMGVNVLVGGAGVKVGVGEPHGGCWKMSAMPELRPPVLHSNWVICGPAPFCTPTVALVPPDVRVP